MSRGMKKFTVMATMAVTRYSAIRLASGLIF
jgi:hypothetical protein